MKVAEPAGNFPVIKRHRVPRQAPNSSRLAISSQCRRVARLKEATYAALLRAIECGIQTSFIPVLTE